MREIPMCLKDMKVYNEVGYSLERARLKVTLLLCETIPSIAPNFRRTECIKCNICADSFQLSRRGPKVASLLNIIHLIPETPAQFPISKYRTQSTRLVDCMTYDL